MGRLRSLEEEDSMKSLEQWAKYVVRGREQAGKAVPLEGAPFIEKVLIPPSTWTNEILGNDRGDDGRRGVGPGGERFQHRLRI
jgi:hypothetical protein